MCSDDEIYESEPSVEADGYSDYVTAEQCMSADDAITDTDE